MTVIAGLTTEMIVIAGLITKMFVIAALITDRDECDSCPYNRQR